MSVIKAISSYKKVVVWKIEKVVVAKKEKWLDPRSIEVAKQNGIDIRYQSARKFETKDFGDFDHIYVMDQQNYRDVVAKANTPAEVDKVELICEAADMGLISVPDPYYGSDDDFLKVFDMVNNACDRIVKKWEDNDD